MREGEKEEWRQKLTAILQTVLSTALHVQLFSSTLAPSWSGVDRVRQLQETRETRSPGSQGLEQAGRQPGRKERRRRKKEKKLTKKERERKKGRKEERKNKIVGKQAGKQVGRKGKKKRQVNIVFPLLHIHLVCS